MVLQSDLSEWFAYEDGLRRAGRNTKEHQRRFSERLGMRFLASIREQIQAQDITVTGTYENSLVLERVQSAGITATVLTFRPKGPEADRLAIYWKALEGGTVPNPNVPKSRLQAWSTIRFGNPTIGKWVAAGIRRKGTLAHPVLSHIFQFDAEFNPVGLTPFAGKIRDQILHEIGREIEREIVGGGIMERHQITRGPLAGRTRTLRRGVGGRFISPRGFFPLS